MGGDQQRLRAVERAEHCLHAQVACRALGFVGQGELARIFLRLEQLGAQHGHCLAAGARGFASLIGGAGATERDGRHGGGLEGVLIGGAAEGFYHHGLAGNKHTGRMTGVHRGDAEGAQIGDQRIAWIVGIDGAQLGLQRSGLFQHVLIVGLVEQAAKTHGGPCVDQAGRDNLGADRAMIHCVGHAFRRTDVGDPAVADEDEPVGNGFT